MLPKRFSATLPVPMIFASTSHNVGRAKFRECLPFSTTFVNTALRNRMKRGCWGVVRYSSGMRKPYPTDLSDDEWNYIEPHMPPPLGHRRPRIHSLREILDAIFFYVS
jgi:hypothetical protein